jgi:hypothetical protein
LSRAAWESQVSGITTEDFNALSGYVYQTLALGNVTFDVPGSTNLNALWVSIPGWYAPIATALVGNYPTTTVRGTFGSAVTAVGADVANLGVNDVITIAVDINGTWSQWQVSYTYPTPFFWGILAGPGESISAVAFAPATYHVGIDNFSYGTGSAVPEPATFALMGAALIGLVFLRKRG